MIDEKEIPSYAKIESWSNINIRHKGDENLNISIIGNINSSKQRFEMNFVSGVCNPCLYVIDHKDNNILLVSGGEFREQMISTIKHFTTPMVCRYKVDKRKLIIKAKNIAGVK